MPGHGDRSRHRRSGTIIHAAGEVSDVASRYPTPLRRSAWIALLVTAMVFGRSSLVLADKVFLSCSGAIFFNGWAPWSGSVTIDLDGGSVTGMVGGPIQQIQADSVLFGYVDPQTKTLIGGRIDRVTGLLSGNELGQPLGHTGDGTPQIMPYNLTCTAANRVF